MIKTLDYEDYTEQQKEAITLAMKSLNKPNSLFRIGGFAGTGKTTILREIYKQRPNGAYVAFAGKACDNLRKKGLPGQTIHSLIYKWDEPTQHFYLVESLDSIDYICGDEFSMVGGSLWGDLQYFDKSIVAVGDPMQLEPVADDDPHLMRNPDYLLDQIHRQAENNPIIKLSMQIREGDEINWRPFERPMNAIMDELLWADVIICGLNKTRVNLNASVRKAKGLKGALQPGDRVICKQNDKELGVYNGAMYDVLNVHTVDSKGYYHCDVQVDEANTRQMIIASEGFNQLEKLPYNVSKRYMGKAVICDFGNVITCHNSQGSQWPKVAYLDERSQYWEQQRHRYTGCTRPENELKVFKHKEDN